MSRYQQAPYQDSPGGNHGGYEASNTNYGGYSDEPAGGYGEGGYGKSYAGGGAATSGENYPMSSNNPYAASGSPRGFPAGKKKRSKWLTIGLPILLLLIIIGAVLGGVLGSRASKNDDNSGSSSSNGGSSTNANTGLPSGVTSANPQSTGVDGEAYLAIATDTYMLPEYATGTNTAGYSAPTVVASPAAGTAWPSDPETPSNSTIRSHPRIGAPAYKWAALPTLIANDPYLAFWNATIISNANANLTDAPEAYSIDGGLAGSGVLDVARRMKEKVKNWSYAYKMTNDTRYADRVWLELRTAAGNNTDVPFGADDGTRWNPQHFLDLGEFCNVFAIGYDWLYDIWTDEQRDAIMWSILNLGLSYGQLALTRDATASAYSWWTGNPEVNGNWNCVNNGGLTLAALAIVDRDPTGVAANIIELAVPNAAANCFQGPSSDGTWAETANYWYFGTTGAAELYSAITTAYGDDRGLSTANAGFNLTSLYHIYAQGMTSLFNYGDHGPNKYSTTANSLLLWATVYDTPRYALYQRDHYDSPEPWSMFWYDPATTGTWWDGLALDHHFDDASDQWATGRSSWSDNDGTYWAIKASALKGHQTHGDLDMGDFVLDAMGQRFAGDLGSGQYLSTGYFSSEDQDSQRWLYYRKRTEGQNTLLINSNNQNVEGTPPVGSFGTTGTSQGLAPSFNVSTDDTAYFVADMSIAYNDTTSVKRGIRMLNGRKQVLLQDELVGANVDVQWRMHTNATVSLDGTTATLELGGQTLQAIIVQGPSGAVFGTAEPVRLSTDPALPTASAEYDVDVPNEGTTVLTIDVPSGGDFTLGVLFNPQWSGFSSTDFVTPPNVALDSWSLTSHN